MLVRRHHQSACLDAHERERDGRAAQADGGDLEEDKRHAGVAAAEHNACSHAAEEAAPQLDTRDNGSRGVQRVGRERDASDEA